MTTSPRAVLSLIRKGESETLEFKESFGREAIEALCSFANTSGGTVLVGVDDKGAVTGVPAPHKALKDWADQIAQATGLHPSILGTSIKGMPVACIRVPESRIKPVMFHGRAFKRSGSTTRQMSVEEITRVAMANVDVTWDEIPEVRASLADISMAKVKAFIGMAKREGRRPVPAGTTAVELLHKLDMIRQGKPTRAAILLFGRSPQRFYSQAILKIGRFRSETLIVDDRRIDGTLFDQVEGAMSYFRDRLETRFEMTGRPQRDVIWEFPLEALREAVTNSLCHRDYMGTRDTEVRLYDREILIWNNGGLPANLSVEALKGKHSSIPRNRQIAAAFFYAGLIEQWGGGIEKMMGECSAAGMPEPVFEEVQGFRVTFRKAAAHVPIHVSIHVTTHVAKVLKAASRRPSSRKELQRLVGLRNRVYFLKRYLEPLMARGWMERTIPDRPRSTMQRYRTTAAGIEAMNAASRSTRRQPALKDAGTADRRR
ncbi:MAG TPA: transcriptional regulator [Elusimicrobia bacterium]|nr:transcriptional regulator [Elusimicrobiota bacterium]